MFTKIIKVETIFALSLFYSLSFTYAILSRRIGINYGQLGSNLPSPYLSIEHLKSMKAGMVKLYDANPETLKLLSGTDLHVSIMVKNEQLSSIASSEKMAENWVRENVLAYYPDTKIRFILVGNEIFTYNDQKMWLDLVPAMILIEKSVAAHNIHNIKVGTPLAMDVMDSTFPPSSGKFSCRIPKEVMLSLLEFLDSTRSFFFIDAYTYYPWSLDPSNLNLDYALLKAGNGNLTYKDPVSGLIYTNLLDQMLDSIIFAMRKLGFPNIKMAIAETGWPNAGDIEQFGANVYNAATYNRNLIKKLTVDPPIGTPAKPGAVIPTFLFSLYDEDQKFGPGTERHWGLLNPNGNANYDVDLTGALTEQDYTNLPQPSNNKPYKGKIWCVVANEVNIMDLGPALDMACGGGGGICDELAPGKGCYEPVSVVDHASYAFSSYWAEFRETGASCYFNGLAVQTTVDPSHGSCQYPSVSF